MQKGDIDEEEEQQQKQQQHQQQQSQLVNIQTKWSRRD